MAKNPFDMYLTEEKKAKIEALNGAEITYRELTMGESDAFNKRLLKDYDGKGDPTIDLAEATKINYEKIVKAVISPELTVEYLESLGNSASKATTEIIKLIDGTKDDGVDEEGNSED